MLHSRLQGKTTTVHCDVTLMLRFERNYRILRPWEDLNELTKAVVDLFTLLFSRLLMLQKSISAFHLKCQLVKWPRRWFLIPSWSSVMCHNTMRSLRMKPQVMCIREFKKPPQLLHWKRYFKIELCVALSVLRSFRAGHVVQNSRCLLSLDRHELFSYEWRERKVYCYRLTLSSEPQI